MAEHIGTVYVDVEPDANGFVRRFEAQTGAGMSQAGRRAGEEYGRGFDEGARGRRPTIRPDVDTTEARAQLAALNRQIDQLNRDTSRGGLITYLAGLAPIIAPIAGAATAAGAAFVTMGVDAVLAVKGASAAMKAGTPLGMQYAAGISSIKDEVSQLEATAARGVLTGFNEGIVKAEAAIPGLNADVAKSTRLLGDLGSNAAGVAVGLAHDVAPAVATVERGLGRLTAQAEKWTNGPGGQRFGQVVADDFRQVEPAIEHLVELVGHLVAAANGPGLGIVHLIDEIATGLDSIPQGVLEPLITSLSALKIASVVSGYFDRLKLSVAGTAVAERDAALAAERAAIAQGDLAAAARAAAAAQAAAGEASRFRSFGSTAVGVLGKVTAGWLITSIAADAAAKATQGWAESSNSVKQFFGELGTTLSDLAHFNFSKVGSDLFGDQQQQWAKAAEFSTNVTKALAQAETDRYNIEKLTIDQDGNLATVQGDLAGKLTITAQSYREYNSVLRQTSAAIKAQRIALASHLRADLPTQAPSDFDAATKALQKNITATQKFLSLGGETKETYKGVAIGAKTYGAALAQTNGDVIKAQALIHGAVDSLGHQKAALASVQDQQRRVNKFLSDSAIITGKQSKAQSDAAKQYELTSQQVDIYSQALGINLARLSKSPAYEQAAEDALRHFVGELVNGNTAITGWVNAVAQFNQSNKTAADRAQLLGAALVSFNGDALSFQNTMVQTAVASRQFVRDFKDANKGIVDLKTGAINFHRAGAAPLLSDLQQMQTSAQAAAQAMYQHEVSTKGARAAAADAARVFRDQTSGALKDEANQLGITRGEAKKLGQEYFDLPKDVVTRIRQLGADTTNNLLRAIGRQLSYLTGHPWQVGVSADTNAAESRVRTLRSLLDSLHDKSITITEYTAEVKGIQYQARAAGGYINGPGTGTSDSIPAMLSNGEYVINAKQAAKHRQLLDAINTGMQGFAAGGPVGDIVKENDHGKTVWIFAGTRYSSLQAAENARDSAAQQNKHSALSAAQSAVQISLSLSPGGLRKFEHEVEKARADIAKAVAAGVSDKALGKLDERLAKAIERAKKQLAALRVRIDHRELDQLTKSIKGTATDVHQAFGKIVGDLKILGADGPMIKALKAQDNALAASVRARDNATKHLLAVEGQDKQFMASIRQAIASSFDVTTAGANANGKVTAGGILADEIQAANRARLFVTDTEKLMNLIPGPYVRELALKGPSALPEEEALLHLNKSQLVKFRNAQASLARSGQTLASDLGQHFFGGDIAHWTKKQTEYARETRDEVRDLRKDIREDVHKLAHRPIEIKVDGQKLNTANNTGARRNARRG